MSSSILSNVYLINTEVQGAYNGITFYSFCFIKKEVYKKIKNILHDECEFYFCEVDGKHSEYSTDCCEVFKDKEEMIQMYYEMSFASASDYGINPIISALEDYAYENFLEPSNEEERDKFIDLLDDIRKYDRYIRSRIKWKTVAEIESDNGFKEYIDIVS